jgi:nitroimidazol reductase NimA-like FMN-containing flavoprotein (pyridoxamine 5'-phosphate oxidase superfamily)
MSGETSPEVQNLEHHECWAMLRTVSVGRLAVLADGRPDIFPVNYTIDGRTLAFRTGEATKLGKASKGAEVALEADGVDPDSGPAWSVVAKGTQATLLVDPAQRRHQGVAGVGTCPGRAGHPTTVKRAE